jgi:hypothetical protein
MTNERDQYKTILYTVHVHRRTRELASGFDAVFRIRDPVPF